MSGANLKELEKNNLIIARATAVVEMVNQAASLMRRFRSEKNVSQAEMAAKLGVSQPRIAQLESGKPGNAPSLEQVAEYAFLLDRKIVVCDRSQIERSGDSGKYLKRIDELEKQVRQLKSEVAAKTKELTKAYAKAKSAYWGLLSKRPRIMSPSLMQAVDRVMRRNKRLAADLNMNHEVSKQKLTRLAHSIEETAKEQKVSRYDVLTIVTQAIEK